EAFRPLGLVTAWWAFHRLEMFLGRFVPAGVADRRRDWWWLGLPPGREPSRIVHVEPPHRFDSWRGWPMTTIGTALGAGTLAGSRPLSFVPDHPIRSS